MALTIAVHNIPEGVIVAAPVFAATGKRWAAVGLALASVRAWPRQSQASPLSPYICGQHHCICVTTKCPLLLSD